jgi:hypothetical protein
MKAKQISERTKAAISAAKVRGRKFDGIRGSHLGAFGQRSLAARRGRSRARCIRKLTLRVANLSNVASIAECNLHRMKLEMIRRDFGRAEPLVQALLAIARDGEVDKWPVHIVFLDGWRKCQGDREAGAKRMRQAMSMFAEQNFVILNGLFKAVLAEAEAQGGEIEAALSTIDSAIAVSERTGQRLDDAETHRVRGPAPAEAAFLAAIASRNSKRPPASNCAPRCP